MRVSVVLSASPGIAPRRLREGFMSAVKEGEGGGGGVHDRR